MRIRHRIPSIFNLSMVDVLCCALGCVILLWLLNLKDARQRAAHAGETDQALLAVRKERDEAVRRDAETRDRLAEVRAQLLTIQTQATEDAADRDRLRVQEEALRKALDQTRQTARDLEKKLQESARGMANAAARAKELQRTADLVPGLRDQVKIYREKYASEEALARALEREMNSRAESAAKNNKNLENLETVNFRLEQDLAARNQELSEANRRRATAENRFAGITLTGRRVVFLIDMSGSMKRLDGETEAPGKWQVVRDTVAHILKSLPDLEKFQVILFAEQATFLLGQEAQWLDFDLKTSPDRVAQAMTAVEPTGGTNMYAALEATFRLRASGLDTIYLLSDGLPNLGEGISAQEAENLKETEKAEFLGKHIRRKLKDTWNREANGRVRVRINAIGFFYESPDVGAFLWALARENDGSFVGMSKP